MCTLITVFVFTVREFLRYLHHEYLLNTELNSLIIQKPSSILLCHNSIMLLQNMSVFKVSFPKHAIFKNTSFKLSLQPKHRISKTVFKNNNVHGFSFSLFLQLLVFKYSLEQNIWEKKKTNPTHIANIFLPQEHTCFPQKKPTNKWKTDLFLSYENICNSCTSQHLLRFQLFRIKAQKNHLAASFC